MRKEQGITESKLKDIDSTIRNRSIQFSEWCQWKGWVKVLASDNVMWFNKFTSHDNRTFYTGFELFDFFLSDKHK